MKRILSSRITLALKILPLCLIVVWLLLILNLYLRYAGGDSFLGLIAPLLVAVSIFYAWEFIQFKKISVDDKFLYVSNYLKEIRIPFEDIDEVVEQGWKGVTYPIDISFNNRSEFGNTIRFMPEARFGHSVRDSTSVIDELRRLAGPS
jgi:hypothetical protein